MGDSNFIKYYICAQNGWNPYDNSISRIPSIYWVMAFNMKRMNDYADYEYTQKPMAEFLASIVAPQNYSQYIKYTESKNNNSKEKFDAETRNSDSGFGESTAAGFDPNRGLIDEHGRVLVSIETMKKHNPNSSGVFIG